MWILYFVNYTNVYEPILEEYFYTSLWSCSAPNKNVRIIARKLLFDVIRTNQKYITKLISIFPQIYDLYDYSTFYLHIQCEKIMRE